MSVPTIAPTGDPRAAGRRRRVPELGVPAFVAVGFLIVVTLIAALAPLIAPYAPEAIDLNNVMAGPTGTHLLGTDNAGRDILSRIIFGARSTLVGPLGIVVLSILAGVPLGLLAAARGGAADTAISRAADLLLSFPSLLFAILAVSLFGPGFTTSILALAIAYVPSVVRLTRSLALGEKEREYVAAYRCAGFSDLAIYRRHILPNIAGILFAQAVVHFGYALIDLAVLSFLGFGVQPPTADWGSMVSDGQAALLQGHPEASLFAGLAIALTVMAVNVAGLRLTDSLGGGEA